jgi:hypothetical protein
VATSEPLVHHHGGSEVVLDATTRGRLLQRLVGRRCHSSREGYARRLRGSVCFRRAAVTTEQDAPSGGLVPALTDRGVSVGPTGGVETDSKVVLEVQG